MTRASSGFDGLDVDDAFWIVVVDDRFVSNDIPIHFCKQNRTIDIVKTQEHGICGQGRRHFKNKSDKG